MITEKQQKRHRRHKRVRAKIHGTGKVPRLCVFRSNKHIWTQLIDDEKGKTLLSASDLELKKQKTETKKQRTESKKMEKKFSGKVAGAFEAGKLIAKKALENKIEKVVFDRGGYKYHGRVKALAEGAREGGLKF
ncbi:MAG: 50S ribosomal protein L18 [Candidatus Nealsonbacteria bacterium CG_4_10_14_0_8_um_filter_35_10]|uniref:Large ribosomal subunit protein uL18 n=2 Tax=Candidatus Nealsoniibacteriota TaxID=1817911 RepID=A0A2M7R7N5_9BACT|nr:MAG: 50S ribosomal protein L18 [Parcubacteria group bacterium CG1_02_36_42]PIY90816.1 MAG: 50S ribosomal protein L18 [Candidatus Nealsonbacteria bacterium CG_4_10_14_0_8_um_filter_35_10]PJB99700.1 MAG: 50S ribosomal protein L18 [Candidatus Nealsonbacteria bacterium CG_4_9_14_0_8_um_filter_35_12]